MAIVVIAVIALAAPTDALSPSRPPMSAGAGREPPLFGILRERGKSVLARIDRRTLRPLAGRRVVLGADLGETAFSPDGSRLAARMYGRPSVLRLADLRRLSALRTISLGRYDSTAGLAWLTPERLLILSNAGCCPGALHAVVIDAGRGRIARDQALGGVVTQIAAEPAATPRELVVVGGTADAIGPARLVVARDSGRIETIVLDRIRAGHAWRTDGVVEDEIPGVTADPVARRAYVVSPDGVVAEVDLATLAVEYHEVRDHRSWVTMFEQWLEPTAYAKANEGATRYARWVGEDVIALTGSDDAVFYDQEQVQQMTTRPVGLRLIDVRTWIARTIDRTTGYVRLEDDALLATGWGWDSSSRTVTHSGLTVYRLNGDERFRAFRARPISDVAALPGRVYARVGNERGYHVLDAATGRVIARRLWQLPRLLMRDAGAAR